MVNLIIIYEISVGESMKYTIQNVVLKNPEVCNEQELYIRSKDPMYCTSERIEFHNRDQCEFSTYFNAFSLNKWLQYTCLPNLSLELWLKGKFKIEIYGASFYQGKAIKEFLFAAEVECEEPQAVEIPIKLLKNDSIYFKVIARSDGMFYGGRYFTEIEEGSLNTVDISLVMCTFKREPYIKRNLKLLTDKFFANERYNSAEHYAIKVIDNGQTLSTDIETDKIRLYPNLNTGGAGGFTRGMMESLEEGGYTHILFMDDDVLVDLEAFEKTYNFLTLLKGEYKDAFIGGAMFRLERKNIQHEASASFYGNHLISLKNSLDMNELDNVLFNEKEERTDHRYTAWWFCCMPTSIVAMNNLPYPFFIRGDDIEYSLRNTKCHITLNGIMVWHEAFENKYSTLMENYFMFRNFMVINTIHTKFSLKQHLKFMTRRFIRELMRYDYEGAELLLDGIEDYLKGPSFYEHADTIKVLKEHASKQKKMIPIKELKGFEVYDEWVEHAIKYETHENYSAKLIRFITINGHLLPSFMTKGIGYAQYGYGSNSKNFYRKRIVVACDPGIKTAAVFEISRTKFLSKSSRFMGLCIKFLLSHKKLEDQYNKDFQKLTGKVFWRRYLKLE